MLLTFIKIHLSIINLLWEKFTVLKQFWLWEKFNELCIIFIIYWTQRAKKHLFLSAKIFNIIVLMNTTFKNIGFNNIVLWICNSSKSIKLNIELSEVKNMSTFALKTLKILSFLVLKIHAIPFAPLIYAREAGKVVTI